jgi:hypothetical protein
MLLCQRISSLVMWEQQSARDLQPHRSWLGGIVRKMSCFSQAGVCIVPEVLQGPH